MTDVILVLNAGSSSIKFSIFALDGEKKSLALVYRGEMEGIGTQPRFVVRDAIGKRLADEQLPANAHGHLSHEGALAILLGWIEGHAAGLSIVAAGHRVVHGGELFSAPVLIDHSVISQLERFVPPPRYTSRITSPQSRRWLRSSRTCRRSPVSTPHSTGLNRPSPGRLPCRVTYQRRA